jgi:predicted Zn-dependent protease
VTFADSKEKNPDEIGNRDVGKGVNFYSIEKEITLGKQLAQEVEHQSRIVDDPVIAEYVNRVGQNLVRNSDAKVPFTIKVIDSEDAGPRFLCFHHSPILRDPPAWRDSRAVGHSISSV